MSTAEIKSLGPRFFKEQDRLRGGPAEELCASNYAAHIGGNPPMNLAAHKQFASAFYSAFPDLNHTIDDTIADGDKVVVRFTLRGTHTENFMGIPATEKSITVGSIVLFHIVNGKVAELRAQFDQMGMMQQLGVIPS